MSDINPTLVELRNAYRALNAAEHAALGRSLADRDYRDITSELPRYAQATHDAAIAGVDIGVWLDRLGAAVLAAKVAHARALNARVDTGEAA